MTNPVRWMPNGWGTPTLYDFSAQIACGDRIVAEQSHRIGLRTIRVVNEKDKDGESFYFEVNGQIGAPARASVDDAGHHWHLHFPCTGLAV